MSSELIRDLKIYAKNNYNVLLTGKHGVGKTAIIKDVFSDVFGEYYTNWRYFSASTLDPWVDFIGVPKNYTNANGDEVYKIIPPDHFTGKEDVHAIFFDEINRADDKTLNALMELIQFKSINGRVYPNLRCIWAAENPPNENYSVNELDPAQRDRFEVQITVPYQLNSDYFEQKYSKKTATIASNWWKAPKIMEAISPRKLDHLLEAHQRGLNISHFTNLISVAELADKLTANDIHKVMTQIVESGDEKAIVNYFNIDTISKHGGVIKSDRTLCNALTKYLDGEVCTMLGVYKQGNKSVSPSVLVPVETLSQAEQKFISQLCTTSKLDIFHINEIVTKFNMLDKVPLLDARHGSNITNIQQATSYAKVRPHPNMLKLVLTSLLMVHKAPAQHTGFINQLKVISNSHWFKADYKYKYDSKKMAAIFKALSYNETVDEEQIFDIMLKVL